MYSLVDSPERWKSKKEANSKSARITKVLHKGRRGKDHRRGTGQRAQARQMQEGTSLGGDEGASCIPAGR